MSGGLGLGGSVCAVIPHFECEAWLAQAIESLLDQTRPPDAVVVVDDASEVAPIDVLRRYPDVTLLAAQDNGGPYRLLQAVIDGSHHDAYLMQDADDWSAPDRLEVLLDTASATGAELVGSHEHRVLVDAGDMVPVRYPADVNAALEADPTGFPLLHPTSLVGRDLAGRLGGFATGMRFGGDAEFLRRAVHVARVVNAEHFGYFRRKRSGSLTTAPSTAHHSPQRLAVQAEVAAVAAANAEAARQGRPPELRPWRRAAAPALAHLSGPALDPPRALSPPSRRPAAVPRAGAEGAERAGPAPVFLVGAPRSGATFLLGALDHHPGLLAVHDARWVAGLLADVAARAADGAAPAPAALAPAVASAVHDVASGGTGRRWMAAGGAVTAAVDALAASFPEARFLHVVRDVDEVVADLVQRPTEGGAYYAADGAWRAWLAGARAGLAAERGAAASRVKRVRHADLLGAPAATVRACLAFLEEGPQPACERALAALAPAPLGAPPPGPPDVVADARRLSRAIVAGDGAGCAAGDGAGQAAGRGADAGYDAGADAGTHDGDDGLDPGGASPAPPEPLTERVRRFIADVVPRGAGVAVASKGDPRLVELDGRTGLHFPQVPGGAYAGHHPTDSADAVAMLESLRSAGAAYLVVPSASFWWLDHYPGLRRHLAERHELVAFDETAGVAYRLGAPAGRARPGGSPPPRVVVVGDPVPAGGRARAPVAP